MNAYKLSKDIMTTNQHKLLHNATRKHRKNNAKRYQNIDMLSPKRV